MAGPIQTNPKGLLSLLQLKQFGRNPSQLSDVVQPSFDLAQQYYVDRYQTEISLGGPTIGPVTAPATPLVKVGAANLVVPESHVWYVLNFSALGTTAAAADRFRGVLGTFDGLAVGNQFKQRGPDFADVASAVVGRNIALRCDQPFWLQGGALLGMLVLDAASAGITFQVALTFVDMLV